MKHHQLAIHLGTLACLAALALFVVRFFNNTSFGEPLQIGTSGAEEESLYAIWKFLNSEPVYLDFHSMPYAASYFNWLFYAFYGGLVGVVLHFFSLPDDWIPQIGRLVTLAGSCVGAFYAYRILRQVTVMAFPSFFLMLVSGFLFFGPLVGYWSITVRPDIWAVALETAALFYFLRYRQSNEIIAAVLFAVFCYLAWGFKQNHVGLLLGVCLFLLFNRQWRSFLIVASVSWLLYAATFLALNGDYIFLMFLSQSKMSMDWQRAAQLWLLAVSKAAFILVPLFLILPLVIRWRQHPAFSSGNGHVRLLATIFATTLSAMLIFSAKLGASENYFIGPTVFGAFLLFSLWDTLKEATWPSVAVSLGAAVTIAGIAAVFFGIRGNADSTASHASIIATKACLSDLPRPVFANNGFADLPWINPSRPSFVLASTYYYKDILALIVIPPNTTVDKWIFRA